MTNNFFSCLALTTLIGLGTISWTAPSDLENHIILSDEAFEYTGSQELKLDSLPSHSNTSSTIRSNKNGEKIYLKIVNGDIKKLKINGKTIAKSDYDNHAELIDGLLNDTPPTPPTPPTQATPPTPPVPSHHEVAIASHEEKIKEHEKQIQKHEEQMAKLDVEEKRNHETSEIFAQQLLKEGLIKNEKNYHFKLTRKRFKVDGKTQDEATRDQYLQLYKTVTGKAMTNSSSYEVSRNES